MGNLNMDTCIYGSAKSAMPFWSTYIPAAKNVLMAATMNAP